MVAYPTSLVTPSSRKTSEEPVHTPSHGGMVGGHEYDLPIRARSPPVDYRVPITNPSPPFPTPRPQTVNGARPRPLSMPMAPQQYIAPGGDPQSLVESNANANANIAVNGSDRRTQKARSSNRVLGDYTLGKTLGAGSMGKVKLAYHNITGEKVRNSTHAFLR